MDDNCHQHHQSITIHETEHHINHSQETDTLIDLTARITETTKDLEITIEVTTTEAQVTIEISRAEAEITDIIEMINIIDKITDQIHYIQFVATHDKIRHLTEITTIVIITINTTDKDTIAETQMEMVDLDTDRTATTVNTIPIIIKNMREEVHRIENKITDIIQETETMIDPIKITTKNT